MSRSEIESALTNETLASWNRTRSSNELSTFVIGHLVALDESSNFELEDERAA